MKNVRTKALIITCCIFFTMTSLAIPVYSPPTEPPEDILACNYAEFGNEPYLLGSNPITVKYYHNRAGSMTIRLYWFETQMKYWVVPRGDNTLTYQATIDGVWRLTCYLSGYSEYATDETRDVVANIPGPPDEGQNNLGSDWARHPTDSSIYQMALQIVGQTTSAYVAAQRIYSHVSAAYIHDPNYTPFRSDVQLLQDYQSTNFYHGLCRSDAVILTAYARTIGIPARIIHLTFSAKNDPSDTDPHYFAELWLPDGDTWKWIPVDGEYKYFGVYDANCIISLSWPFSDAQNPNEDFWWVLHDPNIVTYIPCAGLVDSGYTQIQYDVPLSPYSNKIKWLENPRRPPEP
jgi:hypothetical protein